MEKEQKSWREDAVRIVEELFPATPPEAWDCLLDLRQQLLTAQDWEATLNTFLECRKRLEPWHYLPIYRLRRLFAASLELEATVSKDAVYAACLRRILQQKHSSLADIKKAFRRELFEYDLSVSDHAEVSLRVVERRM